jgi:hypothetical protein
MAVGDVGSLLESIRTQTVSMVRELATQVDRHGCGFVLDESAQVKPEVSVIAEIPKRNCGAQCTAEFEWSSRRAGCPLRVRRCCDEQRARTDDETAEKSVHGVLLLFVKVRAVVAQRGI